MIYLGIGLIWLLSYTIGCSISRKRTAPAEYAIISMTLLLAWPAFLLILVGAALDG